MSCEFDYSTAAYIKSENIILKNCIESVQEYLDTIPKTIDNENSINELVTQVNKIFALIENTKINIEDIEETVLRISNGSDNDGN